MGVAGEGNKFSRAPAVKIFFSSSCFSLPSFPPVTPPVKKPSSKLSNVRYGKEEGYSLSLSPSVVVDKQR